MPSVMSTGEVTVLQVTPHGSNSKTVGSMDLVELCMLVAVMVVQEGIVVVVYSPVRLREQREGMGWGLTVIVLRYSSR